MKDLHCIDLHAHIYPEKIALHAAAAIGEFYGGILMHHDGTPEMLLAEMDKAGIDMALVHSVAIHPNRVHTINDFIAAQVAAHPDRFVGYATLHPDMENPADEIARAQSLGLRGVKMHNDMQQVALDDPRMTKIYEACQGVCPLLLHAGDRRYHYDNPSQIAAIARRFPGLTIIAAHLGGYSEWEAARCLADVPNVLVDTSSSFFELGYEKMRTQIDLFGYDRVLFGTDYPMWNPKEELDAVHALGLSQEALEKILYRNAQRLLNL